MVMMGMVKSERDLWVRWHFRLNTSCNWSSSCLESNAILPTVVCSQCLEYAGLWSDAVNMRVNLTAVATMSNQGDTFQVWLVYYGDEPVNKWEDIQYRQRLFISILSSFMHEATHCPCWSSTHLRWKTISLESHFDMIRGGLLRVWLSDVCDELILVGIFR